MKKKLKKKLKTARIKPFKYDEQASEYAQIQTGNATRILVDRNGDQVYHGTLFRHYTKSAEEITVTLVSLNAPDGKIVVETEGTTRRFRIYPESLGLMWSRNDSCELQEWVEQANNTRRKKKADQEAAIARMQAMRAEVKATDKDESLEQIANAYGVAFDAVRRHRDSLIMYLIEPGMTKAELNELIETHPIERERAELVLYRKSRSLGGAYCSAR